MDDTGNRDVDDQGAGAPRRAALNAASFRAGGSGVQTYVRELVAAVADTPSRFAVTVLVAGTPSELDGRLPQQTIAGARAGGMQRKLASTRDRATFDVIHGLDCDPPLRSDALTVATVHDLALFDVPWAFHGAGARAKRWLAARSIRRADRLIAVSSFTAERVAARFGRDATVVHEAPGRAFCPPSADAIERVRSKYQLPSVFALYVGNHEPRKDLPTLAAACLEADVPLVVAGGAISSTALPSNTRSIGYVDLDDLPALYTAATVVAYVARYEGFALPPVEAMACGACVMATRVGALGEITEDGIEFVPIGDAEGQARALRELVHDSARAALRRERAVVDAGALSWQRAAAETLATYDR